VFKKVNEFNLRVEKLIGAGLSVFIAHNWIKYLEDSLFKQFPIVEFNHNHNSFPMRPITIEKFNERGFFKDRRFSLHSSSGFNFGDSNVFGETSRKHLLAEIELSHLCRFERIILHSFGEWKNSRNFLKQAKEIADQKNVELLLENNAKYEITSPKQMMEASEDTGLKFNLDIGHVRLFSGNDKEKCLEYIDQVKDHIAHVHVHTNNGLRDQHTQVNIDDDIAVSMIKEINKKVKNEVWWMIEVHKHEEIEPTYNTLKKILL